MVEYSKVTPYGVLHLGFGAKAEHVNGKRCQVRLQPLTVGQMLSRGLRNGAFLLRSIALTHQLPLPRLAS